VEAAVLDLHRRRVGIGRVEVAREPLVRRDAGEPLARRGERRMIVVGDPRARHAAVDADVERPTRGGRQPPVERGDVADHRPEVVPDHRLDPRCDDRGEYDDRPAHTGRPELRAFLDRRHAEAPGIERLQRAHHRHSAEAVAVSFDHRQQPRAGHLRDAARVGHDRVEIHVHPRARAVSGILGD
jgi:hypothetical protein